MKTDSRVVYQFGPFEVKVAAGELLKNGRRIKLQELPHRLLVALLENAGSIISREELRSRLWPDDTFVDFDSSLRVAVGKLREALNDNANDPRYVETIPKRGYRFLVSAVRQVDLAHDNIGSRGNATSLKTEAPSDAFAAVDHNLDTASNRNGVARSDSAKSWRLVDKVSPPGDLSLGNHPLGGATSLATPEVGTVAATHSKVESSETRTALWPWFAATAAVTIALVAGGLWTLANRKPPLTAKDTVVISEFANNTGDPVFSESLRQGLSIQLEQSPFLNLISDRRVALGLKMMGQPAGIELTPILALDLCRRVGGSAVLEGSIASLGSHYILHLRATDCRGGKVLDEEQVQIARKEDVLNALGEMAGNLRRRLGEALDTVEQHNTPLADATTPSIEALEAYSTALKTHQSLGASASLDLFKRAVELDPDFAMAHAFLGRAYSDLDQTELARQSIQTAWTLREHTSDRERFFIMVNYQMLVTGDLGAAQRTVEAWARTYPRDALPHILASGLLNKESGRYGQAAEEAAKGIQLDPDFAMAYYNLAVNDAYRDELDEAASTLRRARERGLESQEYLMLDYDLAFLRDDRAAMDRVAAQARTQLGAESWIASRESSVLAYAGHIDRSRLMTRQAVNQATQAGQAERAGTWEAGASVREALFGNAREASERAEAAMRLTNTRDAEYGAGLALALTGSQKHAEALADDLDRRFPEDTSVRVSYLPTLRAQLALRKGDPRRALDLLQVTVPHELGTPSSSLRANFGALYPIYIRGEAFLDAHNGAAAAAEFEKLAQHRGIVVSDPIGALAYLQLGRAWALLGNRNRAKAAYEDFLTLWKDADSDVPVLKQAQAEFANLQTDH